MDLGNGWKLEVSFANNQVQHWETFSMSNQMESPTELHIFFLLNCGDCDLY